MLSLDSYPIDFDSRAAYAAARALRFRKAQPRPGEVTERIGPWAVVEQEGGFIWRLDEKPSAIDLGRFCTKRSIIERKPHGVYRVVLIGESACGSYGYWGHFNLATEIERHLRDKLPAGAEVIDLSVVDGSLEECNDILNHSFTLEPDVIVLYAGNNESKTLLEKLEIGDAFAGPEEFSARWALYDSLSDSDIAARLMQVLQTHSSSSIELSISLCSAFGVPLLYVLPEANTLDWRHETRSIYRKSSSRAHNTSAFLEHSGNLAPFINGVPQMLPEVASTLRELCIRTGTDFYDMPKEMVAAGHAANRDFFIDYCHLSELGIATVAAGIASRLLGNPDALNSPASRVKPSGAASAEERFQGAIVSMIHNYRYGQNAEIVRHWAVAALKSEWANALDFVQTLRAVIVTRVREHLTEPTLQAMGLTQAGWDPRFNLYMTRFVYHARFDVVLARVIEEAVNSLGHTLPPLSYEDPLLESDGSLYSLFYLDTLAGTRPTTRASTRSGWGRYELGIVLEGTVTVEFPSTRSAMEGLEIVLELPFALRVAVEIDGNVLNPIQCFAGLATYTVQFPFPKEATHRVILTPERLHGLDAFSDPTERYFWSLRYGIYPNWGRLHNFRLHKSAGFHA